MSVFVFIYSLFPFLLKWMRKQGLRRSFYLTAAVWLFSQIANHWLFNFPDPETLQQLMPVILWNPLLQFNSFLIGAFTGLYYRERGMLKPVDQKRNLTGLAAGMLIWAAFIFLRGDLQRLIPVNLLYANGLIAPLFAWIVLTLASDSTRVSETMQKPWLVKLGDLSFSIYLLQSPLNTIYPYYLQERIEKLLPYPWTEHLHFYLFVPGLLLAAYLSRNWFEIPAQRFLRRQLIPGKTDRNRLDF